jgi:oligopeptide transport system substrate-binding protein
MRPGVSLVTDRVEGWDDSIAITEDIAQAKQLLAQAGYPDGKGLPEIRILAGVTSPMVDAIVDSLSRNLGIKVKSDIVEGGVYTTRRWQVQKGDYIGYYYGTFAGLPTWATMVGSLWSPKDNQMFSLPAAKWAQYQKLQLDKNLKPADKTAQLNGILAKDASPETRQMADLVLQATREQDEAKQLALFKRAAKIREDQALYIPVAWSPAHFVVRPTIKGLQLRPYPDFFYLKSLDVEAS